MQPSKACSWHAGLGGGADWGPALPVGILPDQPSTAPRAPETWAQVGRGRPCFGYLRPGPRACSCAHHVLMSAVWGWGSPEDVTTTHSEGVGVWQELPSAMHMAVPSPFYWDVPRLVYPTLSVPINGQKVLEVCCLNTMLPLPPGRGAGTLPHSTHSDLALEDVLRLSSGLKP